METNPRRWMSDSLSIQLKRCNSEHRGILYKMLEDYIQAYKAMSKEHTPLEVANSFQQEIERVIARNLKNDKRTAKKITCQKGCGHCCAVTVAVNIDEALLAMAYALEQKVQIDWDKLRRQSVIEDVDEWTKLPIEDRTCIFLNKKKECQIYKYRPVPCRKYFVISDPDFCDTSGPTDKVLRWGPPHAEVVYSAMINAKLATTLPRQLLAIKEIDDEMHRGIRQSGNTATSENVETIKQFLREMRRRDGGNGKI